MIENRFLFALDNVSKHRIGKPLTDLITNRYSDFLYRKNIYLDLEDLFMLNHPRHSLLVYSVFSHVESTCRLLYTLLYVICKDRFADRLPDDIYSFLTSSKSPSLIGRYADPKKNIINKQLIKIRKYKQTITDDDELLDFIEVIVTICKWHLKLVGLHERKNCEPFKKGFMAKSCLCRGVEFFGQCIYRYRWLNELQFERMIFSRFWVDYDANFDDNREEKKKKEVWSIKGFRNS